MSEGYREKLTQEEIIHKVKYDLEWFALNCLQIRDYDSPKAIPFQFNQAQKIIYKKILEAKREKRQVRHLILKARKEGVTTFYNAAMYQLCTTNPFTDVMLTAHDNDATTDIFNRIRMFYDNSPSWVQPMTRASSRKEIVFENPTRDQEEKRDNPGLRSSFRVKTAGATEIMRGGTLLGFHGSEVAFWGNQAQSQMLGVLNGVPDHDPRAIIALESTANGSSGYFYEQVMKCLKNPDDSEWELIFLPWYIFEKYRLALKDGETFEIEDDHEEQLKLKGITDEQLKWRRWAIKAKCDGDLNMFRQEYPSTPQEAFIYTGRTVFDQERLYVFLQNAPTDPSAYDIDMELEAITPDPEGEIIMFSKPEEGREYVIGVDVAEGIDVSEDETKPDPDWSWINISDLETLKQVLSWRTKLDPDLIGPKLVILAHFYNLAWMCVEHNNHGIVVCNYTKKNYPIHRQYITIRHDYITDKWTDTVGWRTTTSTKPQLISQAKRFIREGECWVYDRQMITELQAYRQDTKGRYSGQGEHDDGVIAFALSVMAKTYAVEKKEETQEDREFSVKNISLHDPALMDPFKQHKKRRKAQTYLGSFRKKRKG